MVVKGRPVGCIHCGHMAGEIDRHVGAGHCQQDEDVRHVGHRRALSNLSEINKRAAGPISSPDYLISPR